MVGFSPPREMNAPINAKDYLHTFLLETTALNRRALHKPASVRLLHRWPLGMKVENNAYSRSYFVPRRWHHLVAQKSCTRMEIYLDGELDGSRSLEAGIPTLLCHLVVGRRNPDPKAVKDSRSFLGRLDELAIYDHPLSAAEVRAHHGLARQGVAAE
jgi:Concanavalin A-like lectin/glucanases superfamily